MLEGESVGEIWKRLESCSLLVGKQGALFCVSKNTVNIWNTIHLPVNAPRGVVLQRCGRWTPSPQHRQQMSRNV